MDINVRQVPQTETEENLDEIGMMLSAAASECGEKLISIKVSPRDALSFAIRTRKARQFLEQKSPLAFHERKFTDALERELVKRSPKCGQIFGLMENPPLEGLHQTAQTGDGRTVSFYAVKIGE
ncbi:MAG: hypothetical protein F6J93_27780 [Oscillatoria sp. SIO1A7]|nr:hypothetical protein [Oscillatoria sp. SIO1A7]